jgi:acetyl-CoA synthetase
VELVSPVVRRLQAEADADLEGFWARAADELPWLRRWDRVFVPEPPSFRWFEGAQTNIAWQCVDAHVEAGEGGRAAIAYANERGEREVLTYAQLRANVRRAASALRALGLGRGDRVTLYLPVCPEALAVMLACARIGAIHSVVFAGFGAGALADRIRASGSRAVVTADVTYRKGGEVPLEETVRTAAELAGGVENVLVFRRGSGDWAAFLDSGEGHDGGVEVVEANEPCWILATSGTTATPKLTVQRHGGYAVGIHAMARWVYGLERRDVWWATSDIGWVVGHSYILYAPLLVGCTTLAYEGALDHPGPDTLWRLVEELGVTAIFTSPTAVRMLMRYGGGPPAADISSLERVFCAGEVLNPPAWDWLQNDVLRGQIAVVDHWWQTETGGPVLGNPYGLGLAPIKPGSAGIPLPGMDAAVLRPDGEPCEPGEKGTLVLRRPFPSLTATLWGEPERYAADYWERVPGQPVYYTGDSAHIDEDGYVWVAGRADEVIKIAAHRIGTIEVESAVLHHPAVAEAGVCGRPDEVRGEVIAAFVVLKQGYEPGEELRREVLDTVRRELGPVAVIGSLNFVDTLPKTRSGKIMRRVLKAVVLGQDPGDIATIEDEGSVEDARRAWQELSAAL